MTSLEFARIIRAHVLRNSFEHQAAHLGSALSCVDILSVLFSSHLRNFDPQNWNATNDFLILSKGHAALALYACLKEKDFLTEKELSSYSSSGSNLEEHPNSKIPGVHTASGSLGHGLSFGCGLALGQKLCGSDRRVFVILSDGECNEGTVWEAAIFATAKKLGNLIVLVDNNGWQATGRIEESFGEIKIESIFTSFGWKTFTIDGHDYSQIDETLQLAYQYNEPVAIICKTVKGKGVSFMEDNNNWHYKAPNEYELQKALDEL